MDAYKSCKQKIDDKSLVVRSRSQAAAYKTGIDRKKQEQRKEKLAVGSGQWAVGSGQWAEKEKRKKKKEKRKKKKRKQASFSAHCQLPTTPAIPDESWSSTAT
ncbi:hypothetical protein [Endozoicomonas acroporae]|uniref:hypothetical protein n=1 Tax=Endozoicomonas acroporae TaxID=1701104 RepID=UPI0013D08912|nr:hypothetical protein [Endozoicomonas acroporae]